MGAVTLADPVTLENEKTIREKLAGADRKLISSIRLELPVASRLSEPILVLNGEEQVKRALQPQIRKFLLKLHGVPLAGNLTPVKEYVLAVFQTRVIAMYRSAGQTAWVPAGRKQKRQTFQRVSVSDRSKEVRKVQTLAIRAVYALGLDYATVRLRIGPAKKMGIVHVQPAPRLNQEMEAGFARAILEYAKQCVQPKPPLENIVLGADPEFVMKSPNGSLLIASNHFPVRGKVGCDAIWIGQNHAHKPLFELRPEPSPDPRTLVVRIYQALLYCAKKMKNTPAKWLAGNMPHDGFPIGGHIHFSGIQPDFKLLRALDNYLVLPLILAEDEKGKMRRPKYGFLGDFRYQDHGGFEYRTPPSWLVSPTITKGVFAAAKVIAANYRTLRHDPLSRPEMQEAYYTGDKEKVNRWLDILWADLKSTEDYSLYARYLDNFNRYLRSGTVWDETQDFRKVWQIPPYHIKKKSRQ
jgi:hypothetical protein